MRLKSLKTLFAVLVAIVITSISVFKLKENIVLHPEENSLIQERTASFGGYVTAELDLTAPTAPIHLPEKDNSNRTHIIIPHTEVGQTNAAHFKEKHDIKMSQDQKALHQRLGNKPKDQTTPSHHATPFPSMPLALIPANPRQHQTVSHSELRLNRSQNPEFPGIPSTPTQPRTQPGRPQLPTYSTQLPIVLFGLIQKTTPRSRPWKSRAAPLAEESAGDQGLLLRSSLTRYLGIFRDHPQLVPRTSYLPGYMEVAHAHLDGIAELDFSVYKTALEAVITCNTRAGCMAVQTPVDSHRPGYVALKSGFGRPAPSKTSSLHIKREFVPEYLEAVLQSIPLKCAIPLKDSDVGSRECKLPVLDPFLPSVMKHVQLEAHAQCSGKLYTSYENGALRLHANTNDNVTQVSYQTIRRPTSFNADFYSDLVDQGILNQQHHNVSLTDDFLKLVTTFNDGRQQSDLVASVVERPDVLKRIQSKEAPLDIMILAFDSMSAAHFERVMPLTYAFLRDELRAFLFRGFSIVGQATTPALTAMLTGRTVEENCEKQEGRRGEPGSTSIDGWPFIFKELKEKGFSTMLSEDDPLLALVRKLRRFIQPQHRHYHDHDKKYSTYKTECLLLVWQQSHTKGIRH
ncbi:predicted protein [Nematostella vectensis]|uniref:Uncharacterized protein n=1 Tax=Nematostella vectensis TaxID=45351 RepID=A7SW39_NEMVE|nr:predicted protein [Nematostella vectensis]|eukprot:XP_001624159.1 predicted protein [Nematostella vectensis]